MKKIGLIIAAAVMLMASCGQQKKTTSDEYVKAEGMIWNTTWHVTYQGAPELRDSVMAVLERVGKSLNVFDDNSLVSQVNRQDTTPVNDDFIKVYSMSMRINRLTDGAFDPTLSPLITAWGFGKGHRPTGDTLRIDSIMKFVGIEKTRLSMDRLAKQDVRIQFNFSAIAKGYGCDQVGEMLKRNGVDNWLVEIGGEIAAAGESPTHGKWRVSVDKPILQQDSIMHDSQCVIAFTDMGMATSGNYRNFHTGPHGERFGHTISSKTGRPVATDVLSATVIARSAMEADALATSFMAMGSEAVRKLNKSLRLPVMLVLADSTVWASEQFSDLLVQ